eukprot:TRINITY_DN114739_c0_g1_i1.p1 TRINITY_DN114739_c0_g1~~TRINITY_DN114739_c0_g1_i1.p1  ORF type:complete len:519 (+),score=124.67 TRINITY_DN114739_c0_g1_i1:107-1663(+)
MGAFESSDSYDYAPPPPPRSTLFVVRNGRYEPQNLMPVLPRSDILDFDGFVLRRGNGSGYMAARPPEMRQASLIKNPVSIRRDSAKLLGSNDELHKDASVLSFKFDAQRGGHLSVFLLVREIEKPLLSNTTAGTPPGGGLDMVAEEENSKPAPTSKGSPKESVPRTIELLPQESGDSAHLPVDLELDSRTFQAGLGQCYESPLVDLSRWPAERLCFDAKSPKDIPIAVRLEAEPLEDEPPSIHYTYISIQCARSSGPVSDEQDDESPRRSTEQDSRRASSALIFAQKLQYGGECFVLHEVFGVTSKASEAEVEGGNSDCVICLSEPRDTAVLPCRHMCFCGYCAGIVRLQCDRCPVCRQKVASLLQFKRNADNQLEPAEEIGPPASAPSPASTTAAAAGLEALGGQSAACADMPATGANLSLQAAAPQSIGSAVAASAAVAASRRSSHASAAGSEAMSRRHSAASAASASSAAAAAAAQQAPREVVALGGSSPASSSAGLIMDPPPPQSQAAVVAAAA